jgi:hypothetical protein
MHIERIYIQDNFVPDIVSDQFRRRVIGVSVCLKEGEGTVSAEEFAEGYIKEYIQKNTVNPNVSGVSIVAGNDPLPEIQEIKTPKEKQIDSTIEAILTCTTEKSLLIFDKLVTRENNQQLTDAYNKKLKELQ